MVTRDRGFAEFVETRGPVLWRMASLLELDPAEAERALVAALATTRRRWSALNRDRAAESATRESLSAAFIAKRRREGTLDDPAPATGTTAPHRAALAALTSRQRVLLVVPVFAGSTLTEVARLLNMSSAEASGMAEQAERTFRVQTGQASGALITALDAVALRDAPSHLLTETLAVPRPRRTPLAAAAVVVAITVAVVVAVAPWGGRGDATGAESAVNEWGVPRDLGLRGDLPSLAAEPIDKASTALVVGSTPVVTDAVTGEARAVFASQADPAWFDRENNQQTLLSHSQWTQVVLSPNGEWLLLVKRNPDTPSSPFNQSRADVGVLFLVEISTGATIRVDEMHPSPDATGAAGIAEARLAWAPNSQSFACACSGTLSVGLMDADGHVVVNHTAVRARSVAWGSPGLAVAEPQGGWWYVDQPTVDRDALVYGAALGISTTEPVSYLEISVLTIYALGADRRPDGGHCTLWDSSFSYPVSVLTAAERGGTLCTPVTMQAGRDGFVLVLPAKGPTQRSRSLDIVVVRRDGSTSDAGSFPPGTTTASFAADLVG
ncbi:MAG: RNA polymerase sigma factor [Actinomycetes bacterium]